MGNSCRDCINFSRETESWELSHIWWYECDARGGVSTFRNFPFSDTKCKSFERRKDRVKPTFHEDAVQALANLVSDLEGRPVKVKII